MENKVENNVENKVENEVEIDSTVADTTRGWITDMLNAIANATANNSHLLEVIYKAYIGIENGESGSAEKLIKYKQLLSANLSNRRRMMNVLKDSAVEYNKDMWCSLKHAVEGWMQTTEVWEANQTPETFEIMVSSTDIMYDILGMFLGEDLELCGRCFDDMKYQTPGWL